METIYDYLGKVAITPEGDYDANKDYDRLCLVLDKTNYISYISKKPVPKGIPLSDTSYWMMFTILKEEILLDYNKFVELYGDKLSELDVIVKNAFYFPKLDVVNMHLIVNQLKTTDRTFSINNSNNHLIFSTK